MSPARYRKFALALPGAEEKSHFGKPDFRVRDRIFAGLNDKGQAYVKLTPEQQEMLVAAEAKIISPIPGGWGRKGWTLIDQDKADDSLLKSVLAMAHGNVTTKSARTKGKR